MNRGTAEAMYSDVIQSLRASYDAAVELRERAEVDAWKVPERDRFLELVRQEKRSTLLEVGAGTGVHGKWFQEQGLDVVCTDLSPEMVALCQRKGLTAHVMDFLSLSFPQPFQSAFAMNCLLHVPKDDLDAALTAIALILEPGGLLYLGQYGGQDEEGVSEEDRYVPKRFFSFLSDERMREAAARHFEILDFRHVEIGRADRSYFQALTLRRPG